MKPAKKTFTMAKCLAAIAALLCAWLVHELESDPYESNKQSFLASLEGASDGGGEQDNESLLELDYARVLKTIDGKQRLWQPLVRKKRPPPRPPAKPDLKKMIRGLKVLAVLSTGNEVQAIIMDPRRRTEDVYKKGDKIGDLTIDGFTSTSVKFSHKGQKIELPF